MKGVTADWAGCSAPGVLTRGVPEVGRLQAQRPEVLGKFLSVAGEKVYIRGVTYGTFQTDARGNELWRPEWVQCDFQAIAQNGFNAVRTYTPPPAWFFDLAVQHGLRVMVGLPWEQHINFLDERRRRLSIEKRIRSAVRQCEGHPAILGFVIGNEIPSGVVRWHGQRPLERFLDDLAKAVKAEDPNALVTYVNYPSTEYLNVAAVDFVSFNVYLERQATFERYLRRLHNLAEGRPLVMAEMGLDSRRHGPDNQARILDWQVRTAMASGCAGAFVFAWTDEWHRGGRRVEDWDFGLTTRSRTPKPALIMVREAFADTPFPGQTDWPPISVVVCTYNGGRTLADCLGGLQGLDYPDYEVIVVEDGSRDASADIAARFHCRLIRTANCGLSSARNTGWQQATGDIVAYIDDDAFPDPHWLRYLAQNFQRSSHVAIGGPNLPPPADRLVAQCIAKAPGGPTHVLLTDDLAEHIPGCNMAFRRKCLEQLGGFDPQFRVAGDDVDICWRIQERGWSIGFSPAAMVWHHRRSSIRAYWKQQKGYGKAEALLERKWPEKYNAVGHVTWSGRVYDHGISELFGRFRVYHGVWGAASFQSVYQHRTLGFLTITCMPEWWLVICALTALTTLGLLWRPLLWFAPVAGLAFGMIVAQAAYNARKICSAFTRERFSRWVMRWLLILTLHLLQPLARLVGRLRHGLTAWRQRGPRQFCCPWHQQIQIWSECWQSPQDFLTKLHNLLNSSRSVVLKGGPFERWDLEVRGGLLGASRILMLVEEHGNGKQYLKFRTWPNFRIIALAPFFTFALLALWASLQHALFAALVLGAVSTLFLVRTTRECAWAQAAIRLALAELKERTSDCNPDS
jgi:GT2 family glycosyltransferase